MDAPVAAQCKSLLLARRALLAIQDGSTRIVTATNRRSIWESFERLRDTAGAAAEIEAAASVNNRSTVGWKSRMVVSNSSRKIQS